MCDSVETYDPLSVIPPTRHVRPYVSHVNHLSVIPPT